MGKKKLIPVINRERIIESIYHIKYIGDVTSNLHSIFLSIGKKIDEDEKIVLRFIIQSKVMLDTISLLDEMNNFLFKCENNIDEVIKEKIESFIYIIEPILTAIGKWENLRKFRNNVLAHNFRIDSDNFKSVFLNNELPNYVIPGSTKDLVTLFHYINQMTKIAAELFNSEYEEALNVMKNFERPDIKIMESTENETDKVNETIKEVNERIKKCKES